MTNPPTSSDFASHAALGIVLPSAIDECRARSCSVFDEMFNLEKLRKLPNLRMRKCAVRLVLDNKTGVVRLGKDGHYDWWISAAFDPCGHSVVVKEY